MRVGPPDAAPRSFAGDRRLGEAWTPRQQRKNDALFLLANTSVAVLSRTPRATVRPLGTLLGAAVWMLWRGGRQAVARGLGAAEVPDVGALSVFCGLDTVLMDTLLLLGKEPARTPGWKLDDESRATLTAALAEGRGVVFATGHLGAWERMASGLVEEGFSITTVARESYDARYHAIYERLRGARGVRVLYRGAPGFSTAIVRTLRTGGIVGFPMDIAGRGVRTTPVPFLGALRQLPVGPAILAKRTGAALVVGTPTGPAHLGLSVKISRVRTDVDMSPVEVTVELARTLEARIRTLPTEWPWMLVAREVVPTLES